MQDLIVKPKIPIDAIKEQDNTLYTNRFKIKSESSNRLYLVAQHKQSRKWTCSCTGWITRRYCKHLRSFGIPESQSHQREEMERKRLR